VTSSPASTCGANSPRTSVGRPSSREVPARHRDLHRAGARAQGRELGDRRLTGGRWPEPDAKTFSTAGRASAPHGQWSTSDPNALRSNVAQSRRPRRRRVSTERRRPLTVAPNFRGSRGPATSRRLRHPCDLLQGGSPNRDALFAVSVQIERSDAIRGKRRSSGFSWPGTSGGAVGRLAQPRSFCSAT
jgi:hypothetical protein